MTTVERKHLLVSCESVSTEGRLSSVDGGGRPQAIQSGDGRIANYYSTLSRPAKAKGLRWRLDGKCEEQGDSLYEEVHWLVTIPQARTGC